MKSAIAAGLFVFVVSSTALAQGAGAGARRPGSGRVFDPSTVLTVTGDVTAVREVTGRRAAGVHVDLKTADGVLDVHLGPRWYLDRQGLKPAPGDALEVTGSRVDVAGKPSLIAASVKKGGKVVTLRDANGVPAWSRRPR